MELPLQRYQSVPIVVDAIQVTMENMEDVTAWCKGSLVMNPDTGEVGIDVPVFRRVRGNMDRAVVGDWVLKSKSGFKVYSPTAFGRSFKRLSEAAEYAGELIGNFSIATKKADKNLSKFMETVRSSLKQADNEAQVEVDANAPAFTD